MTSGVALEGWGVKIGLSYDQGTAKYPLYRSALEEAAGRYGFEVEAIWLAGRGKSLDPALLEGLDGLVLTGGADVVPERYGFDDPDGVCIHILPERDAAEEPIVAAMLRRRIPTLAICRGMQFLNVELGGSLIPDLPGHEPEDAAARHSVAIAAGSALAGIAGSTAGDVSSSHHQAIDRLGKGLQVVAAAPDGIVEAVEWSEPAGKPWLTAVQWHPERMNLDEPLSGPLYRAFLSAIRDKA